MTNNLIIKSGIDVNSEGFKTYYDELKKSNIDCYYLDLALSNNNQGITNPIVFDDESYDEYSIDDISFITNDDEIIGHMVYNIQKIKPSIPLGMSIGNHLDLEKAKDISKKHRFSKLEYYCKYNINLNSIIIEYLSGRTNGKLEYQGKISIENKIHIKK